jgi:hypothetical protein
MPSKLSRAIFWALVGTFIIVVGWFAAAQASEFFRGSRYGVFLASAGAVLLSLGIALIVLTVKGKVAGGLKKFLILTGAAAVGIPVSIVLHNVVYGIFIYFCGAGFWDRIGLGDEPFFFVMATAICPLAFLVGAIGSIVLSIKRPSR